MPLSDSHFTYEIGLSYEGEVPPQYRTQALISGVSYVSWYLREGSVTMETAGKRYDITAGQWAFIDPLTAKTHRFSDSALLVSIRFQLQWHGLPFIPPLNEPFIYDKTDTELLLAAQSLCEFQAQHGRTIHLESAQLQARQAVRFFQWLEQWHRVRNHSGKPLVPRNIDRRTLKIISILTENPGVEPVDYTQLSHAVGLSRAQIDRIFKASTGLTPSQWQSAQCLKLAEDHLRDNLLSVKEIAAELNFFDGSHFSKWFLNKMGTSPSAWREYTNTP
ncbi:MAG: helix-turn-helix domain-containing protein [Puniceicoccales bacterium]